MDDPFSTDDRISDYGTTFNYNTDGTPNCLVRGRGVLPITVGTVDESQELYSTCFSRTFANNREVQLRNDADSFLADSPQFGVTSRSTLNATGRLLERDTFQNGNNGTTILKDVAFGYDSLGHLTSMTRYLNPANKAGPVTTTRHYDSLGWMTRLEEPGVAAQTRTFNSWGQVTQVQWCDDNSAAPCPAQDRRSISSFDGSGRLIHREDRVAGATVSGSVHNYQYDGSQNPFIPDLLLGRLWVADGVRFSYDNLGRVKTKQFPVGTTGTAVVETHDYHDDGSEKTLHLLAPDNLRDEQIAYAYDSAGRINSVAYNDGASAQTLFSAAPNRALYDPFGRLTGAQYGPAQLSANYAATGRRLLQNVTTTSGDGAHSRMMLFPTGIDELPAPFDPMGRERQRREFVDSNNSFVRMRSYDALGRLSATQNLQVVPDTVLPDRTFAYDPLGNILTQTDASSGQTGSVSLTYGTADLDRICGLAYGMDTVPQDPNCNVTYDGAGNILTMPKRNGGTRTISYFPNGSVSTMADGASNATFSYDAFGSLQQLTINSTLADQRADKYFGAFVKQRTEGAQSVTNRRIPLPGGTATRHGPTNNWTFAFSEPRGTRFVTDQAGNFVQDIDYQPFGEVRNPSGATPGTTNYENEQWNGGDRLAAFGVVNLGARLYDPVIGRFLSRDPVFDPGNNFNPYAFAGNDPVNQSDPSGMWCISFPTFFCIGNETDGGNTSDSGGGGSGAKGGGAGSAGGNGNHNPIKLTVPQRSSVTSVIENFQAQQLAQLANHPDPFHDGWGRCIGDCAEKAFGWDSCINMQGCSGKELTVDVVATGVGALGGKVVGAVGGRVIGKGLGWIDGRIDGWLARRAGLSLAPEGELSTGLDMWGVHDAADGRAIVIAIGNDSAIQTNVATAMSQAQPGEIWVIGHGIDPYYGPAGQPAQISAEGLFDAINDGKAMLAARGVDPLHVNLGMCFAGCSTGIAQAVANRTGLDTITLIGYGEVPTILSAEPGTITKLPRFIYYR
jgi:RHS repeat-associated protein